MTPDPLLGDIGNPQSLNRYAYVANSPLNATDPSGMQSRQHPLKEDMSHIPWWWWAQDWGVGGSFGMSCGYQPGQDCTIFGNDIFDALEGAPGTVLGFDNGSLVFGFSIDKWWSDEQSIEAQQEAAQQQGPQTQTEQNCEKKILSAGNNQFGTNSTANNVIGDPFYHSTFGPLDTQTANLNISAGSEISMVAPGRYPVNWWTYIIGYGATLHVPSGPSGLDSGQTIPFGQNNDYTEHLDNAYAGWNPLGDLLHGLIDILGIGRNPCP